MMRWLANLISLQEKRTFHGETLVYFALFVGGMRLLLEFLLVGFDAQPVGENLLLYVSWYWLCIFAFGLPVCLLSPPPWQARINVMLVGLFLGFMPPLVDALYSGWGGSIVGIDGFHYAYVTTFPDGWPWTMIAPRRQMPVGEGVVLWSAVGFTGAYMWLRTRSVASTVAAVVLSYAVCVSLGAIMPTILFRIATRSGVESAFVQVLIAGQIVLALLLYLFAYRRPLALRLAARFVHAAPLVAMALVGFAWVNGLNSSAWQPAVLIALCGLMTIAHNDHIDDQEERPGEPERVARHDVVFLTFTWAMTCWLLLEMGSLGAIVLLLYGLASYLYNAPIYRGKRYFPANLKLEGIWGGAAFLIGLVWALVPELREAGPALYDAGALPASHRSQAPLAFVRGVDVPLAALLAAAGWSVLAALKDEKDVETDLRLGTQTVFTLAARRGHDASAVRRVLQGVALACMLLAAWLPLALGRLPLAAAAAMTLLAVAAALVRLRSPRASFTLTLLLLTALLTTLACSLEPPA